MFNFATLIVISGLLLAGCNWKENATEYRPPPHEDFEAPPPVGLDQNPARPQSERPVTPSGS